MAEIQLPVTVTAAPSTTPQEASANANATTQAARPGWQTSEFALSAVTAMLGIMLTSGVVADGTIWARMIGATLALLSTLGYTYGRSTVKAATNRASVLLLVILIGVGGGSQAGCAASQRAETLQAAQIAINATATGMLAYDRPHQDELARTGTPDEAAAALKAYRAKRAVFDKALTVAIDALIIAYRLNDQPSFDGLAKAVAEVAKDYLDLKGITP